MTVSSSSATKLRSPLSKSEREIGFNGKVKKYPDGSFSLTVCDRNIYGFDGWEDCDYSEKKSDKKPSSHRSDNFVRSRRRARSRVRDLALCNTFDYFVTLTLNQEKINRYDIKVIVKKLNVWLDNNVRRKGLRYILVPELHKDGAVHFHGFFNDVLPVVDSGHVDKDGHAIYNLPSWPYGFTTAIKLYGDYSAAVGYVLKYVSKQNDKIGGRFYFSGGDLKNPEEFFVDADPDLFDDEEGKRFDIPEAGLSFIRFEHSAKKEGNS